MNELKLTASIRTKNHGSSSERGKMNKKQKIFLKTACLTRTQMFIEQEFDYFHLVKKHPTLLDAFQAMNQIILEAFRKNSWGVAIDGLISSQEITDKYLDLDSTFCFESELLACFWGNVQYGEEFKNPIQNNFGLNLTKQFRFAYPEIVFLTIRNSEYSELYKDVQKLASCYDLASLAFRMLFNRDKYLILIYLQLCNGLQTLEHKGQALQYYYGLIHALTPAETLKRGANSVLLKPANHLSLGRLKGKDEENKSVEIQEAILYFQLPIGKSRSFYQVLFSNFYGLYQLLNQNLKSNVLDYLDELENILEFLTIKLNEKKNSHQKEKSTLVEYEALILEYFCLFKKEQYCEVGLSEPNGFNKFLYEVLKFEKSRVSSIYKFTPLVYKNGLKSLNLEFGSLPVKVSFNYESIRKKLERWKKTYIPMQILTPEINISESNCDLDYSDVATKLWDFDFVEK